MEKNAWEMYFYYSLNCYGIFHAEIISCGAILFGHLFMYCLQTIQDYLQVPCIDLQQKQKRKVSKTLGPRPLEGI